MLILGVSLHHEPLLTLQVFAVNPVVGTQLVDAVTQDRLASTAFADGIGAVIQNNCLAEMGWRRE